MFLTKLAGAARAWCHVLKESDGAFEPRNGPRQVALEKGQLTDPRRGKHQAAGVRSGLGNPQPFFHEGTALGEQAQLGLALGQVGTREHRGQENHAEALAAPCPVEKRDGLPEAVDRASDSRPGPGTLRRRIGFLRERLQDDIPAGRGEPAGALADSDGLVIPRLLQHP